MPHFAEGALMPDKPGDLAQTWLVTGSYPAAHPSGATALVFRVQGGPPIAFWVNQQSIDVIRKGLADCEAMWAKGSGRA